MDIEQQIRAKQDSIAQLLTAKDKAIGAVQNEIYVSWNSYQSRIDALQRVGSMDTHDQATAIKAQQQSDFQTLGANKMQIEADYESKLNAEYQAVKALEAEKKQLEKERQEAKLKELREREEANRREQERRNQLTKEQREAEDKARHEAKLKEIREQEQTRQRGRDFER